VDPVELERSEVLATAAFLFLASLTEDEGVELAYLAGAKVADRLGEAVREGIRHLLAAPPEAVGHAWNEVQNRLDHHARWGMDAVRDILHFNDGPRVRVAVEGQLRILEEQSEALADAVAQTAASKGARGERPPDLGRPVDNRVPVRLTRGPLAGGLPASALPPERAAWYSSPRNLLRGSMPFELVNFIDGERTVTQIRDAISAEFAPIPTQAVARYVEDLVTAGLAEWR
jgi:hypothetical protein